MTPFEVVQQHYQFPDYIKPHPLQVGVINDLAPLPNQGEWLEMGCVDSETEYLSPTGWVKMPEYAGGPVAQFSPEPGLGRQLGRLQFVEPLRYIKEPCGDMVVFRTARGMDQKLSPEHRVLHVSATGVLEVNTAQEIMERDARCKLGLKRFFLTTAHYDGGPGLDLSEWDLRLQVAVIADGHFPNGGSKCFVRVKKPRKIERMRWLLKNSGREFTEMNEPWKGCEGFVRFAFQAPIKVKVFDARFYSASRAQLEIIESEVFLWDGSQPRNPNKGRSFHSSQKESADFVQFVLCALGSRAYRSYHLRVRSGRPDSHEYTVVESKGPNLVGISGTSPGPDGAVVKRRNIWVEPSTDGFKYCFEVPSSFLVLRRNGNIFVTGNCGKTYCSTIGALYNKITLGHAVVVIMPPILVRQWGRWLRSIKPALSVTEYRGTPAERKKLDLSADFVLVGVQIFKKDFDRFCAEYRDRGVTVIVDEATMLSNINSDNHSKVFDFCIGRPRILLSGTPMNKPLDVYGLLKFTTPGTYRNKRQFENLHVADRDFFGNPSAYKDLDLLGQNLMLNSRRILYEDMYSETEQPLYVPLDYDLDPAHYKLYKRLADEEILKLPDGGKVEATTVNKLLHALGQIVVNWGHFAGDPKLVSNSINLIEEKLEELGDGKLLVFANYRMSIAALRQHLGHRGIVTVNSEITEKQKEENLLRFMEDPACRVMAAQFVSAGKGLDGMQHVCHHALFVEPCQQPRDFHQAVARLNRLGQRKRVMVMMATASGTTQVRGFRNLIKNDTLVNQVIRNAVDLKEAIFGQ